MEIIEKKEDKNTLKLTVDSNEESLFSLVKVYLENMSEVELVGFNKSHYLVDKTDFYLKTKKEKPTTVLKKTLAEVKKDLQNKKVK